MASKQGTVDFILEQMLDAGDVSARKMFGEYGVYCGGKLVALVCDDQLFVKPTEAGKVFIGKVTEGLPYPGAKPWFLVAGSRWENSDWLAHLVRVTAAELPTPAPKAKTTKPKSAKKPQNTKEPKSAKKSKPRLVAAKPVAAKPVAAKPVAAKPVAAKPAESTRAKAKPKPSPKRLQPKKAKRRA